MAYQAFCLEVLTDLTLDPHPMATFSCSLMIVVLLSSGANYTPSILEASCTYILLRETNSPVDEFVVNFVPRLASLVTHFLL